MVIAVGFESNTITLFCKGGILSQTSLRYFVVLVSLNQTTTSRYFVEQSLIELTFLRGFVRQSFPRNLAIPHCNLLDNGTTVIHVIVINS
jgi:hypothetical protein